jgi:ADP-ribose pyrophosphatase YjhB (NUDIX family)
VEKKIIKRHKKGERPLLCPKCGEVVLKYKNPYPTVDIIIRLLDYPDEDNIVLIKRLNPPYGWALPGGFVEYKESVETTAVREALEETGLKIKLTGLFGVYSDPDRDPRYHTISTIFSAEANGSPKAGDDAGEVQVFTKDNIPEQLAFDHKKIIDDYFVKLSKRNLK